MQHICLHVVITCVNVRHPQYTRSINNKFNNGPYLCCWPGLAWHGLTWPDLTWPDLTWPDLTWPDLTWPDLTWPDLTWPDLTWPDLAWPDLAWPGLCWHCLAWHGLRRSGTDPGDFIQHQLPNSTLLPLVLRTTLDGAAVHKYTKLYHVQWLGCVHVYFSQAYHGSFVAIL